MSDARPPLEPLPARTNHPYDAPDAVALVRAVSTYLHDDLLPRSDGADRWILRVAANALAIAAREIEYGEAHRNAHRARLEALGVATDEELAAAIRAGDFDDRWAEVSAAVSASVRDSLDVANPAYAVADDGGPRSVSP